MPILSNQRDDRPLRRDQAEMLRMLVRDRLACQVGGLHRPRICTIAVASGKGGVGKTSLAVNLSVLLARNGRGVRLVDADFGLANAEVLFGLRPEHTLDDVLRGRVDVRNAWTEAAAGVKLLSSGTGLEDMANLEPSIGAALLDHVLSSVPEDEVVLIDTGPGIDESVVSLLELADEVLMLTTPDPTAVADTYAAVKALLTRVPSAEITLVANCCASPAQAAAVAGAIDSVCGRFLGGSFSRHEYLPSDAAVGWAVRTRKPLAVSSPRSHIAPWLRKMAIRLEERIRMRMTPGSDTENPAAAEPRPIAQAQWNHAKAEA